MALFAVKKTAPKKQEKQKVKTGTNIIQRISQIKAMVDKNLGHLKNEYIIINTVEELEKYIDACIDDGVISIDTETTGLDPIADKIVGLCIYCPSQKAAYVPINHISYVTNMRVPNQLTEKEVGKCLQRIVDNDVKEIFFNANFDVRFLKQCGVNMNPYWDTSIASRMLNENEESRALKPLHNKYCLGGKGDAFKFDDLFNGITFDLVPIEVGYIYAAHDAIITYEFYKFQEPFLTPTHPKCVAQGLEQVAKAFMEIEMPVSKVLCEMECTGIYYDMEHNRMLHDKYVNKRENVLQECYKLVSMYDKEISDYKLKNVNNKLSDPINLGSPTQLAVLFYDIIKVGEIDKKTPRGTGADILKRMKNPLADKICEYKEVDKLLGTFIDKLPNELSKDNRIHCKFHSYGADTGRMSCISEGTLVSTPSGDIPIEDIKIGDWVYCYTDDNKLTLSKVKNVWDNGYRDCVRLKWKSKYDAIRGELVCTPDHFVKTANRGWVMAKDLKVTDSIPSVHRRKSKDRDNVAIDAFRSQGGEEEHLVVAKIIGMDKKDGYEIHHSDNNHMNNSPDNLTYVTRKVHNNIHRYDNPNYGGGKWTYDKCIEELERVKGELTKVDGDYQTFKARLEQYRINYIQYYTESYSERPYKESRGRVSKDKHLPLNKGNLVYALDLSNGDLLTASGYFGVSLKEFTDACDKYELLTNHNVYSVEYLEGVYHVYDLEVEEYHNFIASELCVHNCSSPNLQQIPSKNHDVRQSFKATDGYVLMSSDFSQQEPKALAALCAQQLGDTQMLNTFLEGKDLYSAIASAAFHKPYDECLEFRPDGTTNPDGKKRRTQAKSILLGVLYGRGEASIAEQLGCSVEEAKAIKNSVFEGFPAIKHFEEESLSMAKDYGYVTTIAGRKRRLPILQEPDYEFSWINGTAPDDDPLGFDSFDYDSEVSDRLVRKYTDKLKWAWGRQKQDIIAEAEAEGVKIIDNTMKKADATRQVVNSRIQGSSADLTKVALIALGNNKHLKDLGFRVLVPVHDEFIVECPKEYALECKQILADTMCKAAEKLLGMPISTDVEVTERWYGEPLTDEELKSFKK